jgi:four helix bundle protein
LTVEGLKRLKVWVKAKDYALKVYRELLPLLPSEEKWNLNQQLRRSSLSISANIAEGYGRFYYQENIRFCYIARGSLDETLSHIVFAFEAKYIPASLFQEFQSEGDEIDKMLNGYISYLKKSKQGANEPGANSIVREDPELYFTESNEDANPTKDTVL